MRLAILIFGALNAILYAGLTPLWEGFDEPFHYGYVQHMWNSRTLLVQKHTCLSEEVWQSFRFAPASFIVQRNLPMVTTFDDYFRLPAADRLARRSALEQLDPKLADVSSQTPNYESQQAPLAYVVLAPFHALWAHSPLPVRVWRLRLLCALTGLLATGLLVLRLAKLLAVDGNAAVFLLFSSQMFYATTAHITNDCLTVPLFLLVLTCAVSLYGTRRRWDAIALALALAAGLLTKAYFLAMVPFALILVFICCTWRERVLFTLVSLGPSVLWYVRNVRLYGDLGGQQENVGGTPVRAMLAAVFQIPWPRALVATARNSLWEGNSSATTFGSVTIWLMIALLAAALVCYLRRRPPAAECVVIAGMLSYGAGLFYNTLVQWVSSRGDSITPAPWYVQLLAAPGFCLAMAGLARSGRAGSLLRGAMCWLWAYVICATYVAKLVPMYGGYGSGPARLAEIARWYWGSLPRIREALSTTAMISPTALFVLTGCVVIAAVTLAWRLSLSSNAAP